MAINAMRSDRLGYSLPPNLGLPTLANKAAMVMTSITKKVYWPNTWKTPQANAVSAIQASRKIMFFNITRTRKLKVNSGVGSCLDFTHLLGLGVDAKLLGKFWIYPNRLNLTRLQLHF